MTDFFINRDGYKMALRPHLEGYCLVYLDDDGCIHIPLDMRDLVALRSEVNLAIDDLKDALEQQPFNPSW